MYIVNSSVDLKLGKQTPLPVVTGAPASASVASIRRRPAAVVSAPASLLLAGGGDGDSVVVVVVVSVVGGAGELPASLPASAADPAGSEL